MTFAEIEAVAKVVAPYLLGSGGALAWLNQKRLNRIQVETTARELALKERELEDARAGKEGELLRARDVQMYQELRDYCSRLESRITTLESQQEASQRLATEALAQVHAKELELTRTLLRVEIAHGKCTQDCGLAALLSR